MVLAKFTASTQKLKKAGLYQIGARKNLVIKVDRYANCTMKLTENGPIIIPENLIYFFSQEEVQDLKDGAIRIKNGKVK
ncbi:MAG: hypothetical protein L0G53_07530 [Acinetobacter sp.]|uniref:hypothetical protein n=1 Tax=Acinetobacter sp. TaxID=472 RepID=UPI0026499630|nr:hypothetical protein [Acinetobacter sp.]MDN5511768.1 hypothetical protein [Acinetobacter sp.]MDN5524884.1 hypothetical protein [Acinetobacter sp.]